MKRIHFQEIDSTNSFALAHLEQFSPDEMTLVTADFQQGGRGRFERRWVSPPKMGIAATFVFFLKVGRTDLHTLTHLMALSTLSALEERGFVPSLKWPNDIYFGLKKAGGILTELSTLQDRVGAVLGLGLNVNETDEMLSSVGKAATSLFLESGVRHDREELLRSIAEHFERNLRAFMEKGFSPFLSVFRAKMRIPQEVFYEGKKGELIEINPDGSALIQFEKECQSLYF